jgi:hypothetical protein
MSHCWWGLTAHWLPRALIPGDRDHKFSGKRRHLEAAQRIAGHADSRTTKLYDRRGQKVLLEDMERIRY